MVESHVDDYEFLSFQLQTKWALKGKAESKGWAGQSKGLAAASSPLGVRMDC